MTLTGMKKHVGVLEQAGLVQTEKVGRVRTCRLGVRGLQEEAAWIEEHRRLWAARFDALDHVVQELKMKEEAHVTNPDFLPNEIAAFEHFLARCFSMRRFIF